MRKKWVGDNGASGAFEEKGKFYSSFIDGVPFGPHIVRKVYIDEIISEVIK